jgi:hypothetical protein
VAVYAILLAPASEPAGRVRHNADAAQQHLAGSDPLLY